MKRKNEVRHNCDDIKKINYQWLMKIINWGNIDNRKVEMS